MLKEYRNKENTICLFYSFKNNILNISGIVGRETDSDKLYLFLSSFLSTFSDCNHIIFFPGLVSSYMIDFLINIFLIRYSKSYKIYYNYQEMNINFLNQIIKNKKIIKNDNILNNNNNNKTGKRISLSISNSGDPVIEPFNWYAPNEIGILVKYKSYAQALNNSKSTNNTKAVPLYLEDEDIYDFGIKFYDNGNYSISTKLK